MQTIDLLTLIPKCHEAAKAKGFWDVKPNRSQQLMLAISELSEALEGDRKGHYANLPGHLVDMENAGPKSDSHFWITEFRRSFEATIKDSPADELADAYIRLCDFAGGFGLDIEEVATEYEALECPENFAEALLGITAIICMTDYELDMAERAVGMALAHIEALCVKRGIDLATHIDLKLRYNATRPAKHGKAY